MTSWFCPVVTAEEDRRRRLRRNLRGVGSADSGECGVEGGVSAAAKAGVEDGGGGAEEASG